MVTLDTKKKAFVTSSTIAWTANSTWSPVQRDWSSTRRRAFAPGQMRPRRRAAVQKTSLWISRAPRWMRVSPWPILGTQIPTIASISSSASMAKFRVETAANWARSLMTRTNGATGPGRSPSGKWLALEVNCTEVNRVNFCFSADWYKDRLTDAELDELEHPKPKPKPAAATRPPGPIRRRPSKKPKVEAAEEVTEEWGAKCLCVCDWLMVIVLDYCLILHSYYTCISNTIFSIPISWINI